MFSEQFFDLLLNLGDDWKVDEVKMNFILRLIFLSAILVLRQNVQLVWSYVVFTIIENPVGGVI